MTRKFNRNSFKNEAEALEHFQSRGWQIASNNGGNGISLTHSSVPDRKVFLYRLNSTWRVIRS